MTPEINGNAVLYSVLGIGAFTVFVLPSLLRLRVFVRPSELTQAKEENQREHAQILAHVNDHFVRKDDLKTFQEDVGKRLDDLRDDQREIKADQKELLRIVAREWRGP